MGDSRVIRRADIDAAAATASDQLLVGLNRTRRAYNRRMRELYGHGSEFPEAGDKLVCLKNNTAKGLLNGGIWIVKTTAATRKKKLALHVAPEDDPGAQTAQDRRAAGVLQGREDILTPEARRRSDEFDYGYALTVHKAQGSQWGAVVLFDESFAFREHRNRWLYTGITRAAEKLTVVI